MVALRADSFASLYQRRSFISTSRSATICFNMMEGRPRREIKDAITDVDQSLKKKLSLDQRSKAEIKIEIQRKFEF